MSYLLQFYLVNEESTNYKRFGVAVYHGQCAKHVFLLALRAIWSSGEAAVADQISQFVSN